MRSVERKGVALQHDDVLEVIRERSPRGQAAHPGADHHSLPADQCGCHQRLL
jgi:hypothetical protein